MKLVSVIIPVYNVEGYIEKCLDSVCKQTYENLQILLVNDGSTDSSGSIAERYADKDPRIILKHISNGGVSNARNLALNLCSGDYICFVDADDYLEPDAISVRLESLESSHADIYLEKNIFYNNEEKCYASLPTGVMKKEEAFHNLLNFNYPTSLWAGMFRADLVKGNYLTVGIHFWEDFEFQYRLIRRADRIVIGEQPVYHYVLRENSANQMLINKRVLSCLKIPGLLKKLIREDLVKAEDFNNMCENFYQLIFDRFLSQKCKIQQKYYHPFQRYSIKYARNILQTKPDFKDKRRYLFCCFAFHAYVCRYRRKCL